MPKRERTLILDLVGELLDQPGTGVPGPILAARAAELFDGDLASVIDLDMVSGRGTRLGCAPDSVGRQLAADIPRFMTGHPVMTYYFRSRAVQPLRATDAVPAAEWRRSTAYAFFVTNLSVRHQLTIPWSVHPQCFRGIGVFRSGRDFTEQDRRMAQLLQPSLIGLQRLRPVPQHRPLTPREDSVLGLLYEGLTVQAIAHRLGISARTAGHHVEAVYSKLGAHDRVDAVLRAQRLHLLPCP